MICFLHPQIWFFAVRLIIYLHLFLSSRTLYLGGNEYAWEGKGLGLESDQDLFFFQLRNILFHMKLSANYLSAYLFSAQ